MAPGNVNKDTGVKTTDEGFLGDAKKAIAETGSKIKKAVENDKGIGKASLGETARSGLRVAGAVGHGLGDIVASVIDRTGVGKAVGGEVKNMKDALDLISPKILDNRVTEGLGYLKNGATEEFDKWAEKNPEKAQDVRDVWDTLNGVLLVEGGIAGAKGLPKVANAATESLEGTASRVAGARRAMSVEKVVNNRIAELSNLESRNAGIRKAIKSAADKGVDVKKILAETDLLQGAVDKTGAIRTTQEGGAVSQLQDFIKPQESVVSKVLAEEGKTIKLTELEKRLKDEVRASGVKGGALTRGLKNVDDDIAGYALEANEAGEVPLNLVQDAKIDKYRNINYLNPEASRVDKSIARGLKKTIEDFSERAKPLNDELARHYETLRLLEALDGKIVAGGKMGKYFAQTIGAVVGSHFGPLGALAGAEAGNLVKGLQMARKFGGTTGKVLEESAAMKEALKPKLNALPKAK